MAVWLAPFAKGPGYGSMRFFYGRLYTMIIKGKVAVVTGAASGIGNAVAHQLIECGAKAVAIVDLTDSVEDAADALNKSAGRSVAHAFQGDVTDSDFRRRVFAAMEDHGLVQVCVPAAGILRDAMAVKIDRDTGKADIYDESLFRQVLEVNLLHPTYWSIQMIAGIAEHRAATGLGLWTSEEEMQGVAVIIGSVSSRGNRGQVSYSSAKSGLNAVAKTLNAEGASFGVQAKIIHPGFVQTPMVEQLPDGLFEEHLRKLVPIDRMITPGEIAATVIQMIENPILSGPVWADGGLPPLS